MRLDCGVEGLGGQGFGDESWMNPTPSTPTPEHKPLPSEIEQLETFQGLSPERQDQISVLTVLNVPSSLNTSTWLALRSTFLPSSKKPPATKFMTHIRLRSLAGSSRGVFLTTEKQTIQNLCEDEPGWPARWSSTLSSKVNLHHAIDFGALSGANLVT